MWLSASNIGLSLSILCGTFSDRRFDGRTNTFSFLVNFFILSNLFWSAAITKTMALVILQRNKLLELLNAQSITPRTMAVKRMIKFHFLILTGSFVLSLVPIFTGGYSDFASNWYWYNEDWEGQLTGLFCYYLPLLVGIVHSSFVFYYLGQVKSIFVDSGLSLGDGRTLSGQLYELAMSLKNYPIATSLISIWAVVAEIVRLIVPNKDSSIEFGMFLLLAILQSSQGVFHVLIYFYRSYRRGTIWSRDEGLCGLCCGLDPNGGESKFDPNSPLMLAIVQQDQRSNGFSSSDISASRPSMLDVERAIDTLCPVFDTNENSKFGSDNSHGEASNTHYGPSTIASSQSSHTTETSGGPFIQASVSVRVGHDCESSMNSNTSSVAVIKNQRDVNQSSFGICFED